MSGRAEALAPSDRVWTMLTERALGAMERAYAPYSRFRVGAALLASDGSVTEGCNIENAAYPVALCAERAAVAAAVTRGARSFRAIVIATESERPASPCGMCRQVLMEFAPELSVLSVTRGGAQERWSLAELLPHAFTPTSLGRA